MEIIQCVSNKRDSEQRDGVEGRLTVISYLVAQSLHLIVAGLGRSVYNKSHRVGGKKQYKGQLLYENRGSHKMASQE